MSIAAEQEMEALLLHIESRRTSKDEGGKEGGGRSAVDEELLFDGEEQRSS
jgi:hypothetical protein